MSNETLTADLIVDYIICSARDLSDLSDGVKRMIGDGWQPHGGIGCFHTGPYDYYVQAMVKYG